MAEFQSCHQSCGVNNVGFRQKFTAQNSNELHKDINKNKSPLRVHCAFYSLHLSVCLYKQITVMLFALLNRAWRSRGGHATETKPQTLVGTIPRQTPHKYTSSWSWIIIFTFPMNKKIPKTLTQIVAYVGRATTSIILLWPKCQAWLALGLRSW